MTRPWMRWTDDEIAKLKTMAKKYPTDQIAQELGRGAGAIHMKAHELGNHCAEPQHRRKRNHRQ